MEGCFCSASAGTWALGLLLIGLVLLYGHWPNHFFRTLGVPGPKPLPVFGNMFRYRKGIHGFDMECFVQYGRVWGIFDGRVPVLCTVDKAMIKSVLVKECYTLFTNRREFGLNGPLYDTLFVSKDEDWKRIRSVLSPSFTGGRLKELFWIMASHSKTLVKNLEETIKRSAGVDVKEFFGAYTMDVITSSAFSVDMDSLNNPHYPFVANVKKIVEFGIFSPVFLITALFPFTLPLLEKLSIGFFPNSVVHFFFASLQKIKMDRMATAHKTRADFLQVMLDSQTSEKASDRRGDKTKKGLTDHEILSQCMMFIFAGYESSSSTLSFLFYNLATNPDTMKKLQEEIDQTFPNKARVEYEQMVNMDYLEAALNESLRLFPITNRIDRVCKKATEMNGISMPKELIVNIPTYVLHRDPQYWSDPETFNPERFTKGNKENVDPYVFLPFGAGPRNCIGMRFALVMIKLAVVETLQRFDVDICDETKIPMELGFGAFMAPKEPIKLQFRSRGDGVCNNHHQ